jgi:predicted porin
MIRFSRRRVLLAGVLFLCLPAAGSVQAYDSVAVSGELNVALVHLEGDGADGGKTILNRLDSNNSRLVFRGREALGNDWHAMFLVSNGFRVNDGNGKVCNRECTIGLAGPYGTLKLGRQLDVYDDVSLAWYYQDAAGNHNPLALWANCGGGAGLAEGCVDNYLNNSIRYDTPSWSGVSGSFLASKPIDERPTAWIGAAGIEWRRPQFYGGFAFQRQLNIRAEQLAESAATASFSVQNGTYYFATAVEHLLYHTPTGTIRRNYWGMLIKKNVFRPAGTFWLNVGRAGCGYGDAPEGKVVNALMEASESGALMWTFGYAHRLSAQTRVYLFYNAINNQRNAKYAFDPQLAATGNVRRLNALAFGMSKKF